MTVTKKPKKVAVVIPCYNEANGIAQVIARLPTGTMRQHGLELTIYVVDNNSTDATAQVAKKAGATVLYEAQKGKGNALRTGFRGIPDDTDYVVMLDGDNTYNPQEILRMLEPLRSNFCDVVVGSRLGGRIKTTAMKPLNLFGNKLFTFATRVLYGATVSDVLTGYFAWKKPVLDALEPHIKSPGFAVEMEMITKMARLGYQLASVPISYDPRAGESNLRPIKDGVRILGMLLGNLAWRPPAIHAKNRAFAPRKIVFVSDAIYPYMKGGKEKRLYEIATRLAAVGHDVHIYTMHWWNDPAKDRTEDGVHLHALCRYHQMYTNDRRTIKEGVAFGLACFKLFRVPFDVLDVDHMPFFPIFSTWLVCTLRGRKLYATWHEALSHHEWVTYMGPLGMIAALIERASIRLPHRITAASLQTKERLSIQGRMKHVALVASGIDVSVLNSVQPASITCDVLYVGRLVKNKNIEKLILAIKIVAQSRPQTRCLIIGQGIEKQRLQQMVRQHSLQKNITFLEPLTHASDVYAYMKAAKVFCSPSTREGFGIVALEALGCGTPVVTIDTESNAARHLIKHGQNGSVVPFSASALANALLHWLSVDQKPAIAPHLADYDWHRIAQKQAEVYTQ